MRTIEKLINRHTGIFVLMLLGSSAAVATDLVYHPVNPSFGGNPFNGPYLLSNALAQVDDNEKPLLLTPVQPSNSSTNIILVPQTIADSVIYLDQNGELNTFYTGEGGGEINTLYTGHGGGNVTSITQSGSDNSSGVLQAGSGNSAYTSQPGDGNAAAIDQRSGGNAAAP